MIHLRSAFLLLSAAAVVCVGCGSDASLGSRDTSDGGGDPTGGAQAGGDAGRAESQGSDGGSDGGSGDGGDGGEVDDPHHWSKRFGDRFNDFGLGVAVDGADHVVVTGLFQGAVDFGGGQLVGGSGDSSFLAKYDPAGKHIWSQSFGGKGVPSGGAGVAAVAADAAGNIAVTGVFYGTVDFGGGPLVSAGAYDVFVARYDAAGNHLWSRHFFGNGFSAAGSAVAIDADGNVIVTGDFEGTVDAGGGPLTSAGDYADIFVVKYDSAGHYLWSKRFGSSNADVGYGIASDAAGNILVTGGFRGSVDFGGGPLTTSSIYDYDVFLAKFDAGGAHVWSKRFGSNQNDSGYAVAVDGKGNVVVSGAGGAPIDFGGGTLTHNGIFLAKYDEMGNHLWSKAFGSGAGKGVAFDPQGNIVLTGGVVGARDFGGGPLVNAGGSDIYVSKFDTEGNHLWSKSFGDTENDRGYAVATDRGGGIVVTGAFLHSVDFGNGPLMSAGGYDIFLAKLSP
jgi:Beta-propeller repeat